VSRVLLLADGAAATTSAYLSLGHDLGLGLSGALQPLCNTPRRPTIGPFPPSASTSVDARLHASTDVDALGVNEPYHDGNYTPSSSPLIFLPRDATLERYMLSS